MNHKLSEAEFDAYLQFIYLALVYSRNAIQEGRPKLAEELVDMLHNLPSSLRGSTEPWFQTWSAKGYYDLFVAPIRKKYPELKLNWDAIPRR